MDVNESGGLYTSYGKVDAARYIKNLGPTKLGKLFGTSGDTVQHITVKSKLKMPSDSEMAIQTAKILQKNPKVLESFNKSLYSSVVTKDLNENVNNQHIYKAIKNPNGKDGQKLAYGVSIMLGDPNYKEETKTVYKHFKDAGYDAIPDFTDRLSGTSNTAMIILNHDKVKVD